MSESNLIGIYAGTFDPLTNGHKWMIEESAKLFDTLIVAIGINPIKKPAYHVDKRLEVIQKSVKNIITRSGQQIVIDSFVNMYLVDFAKAMNATHIVRGIRSVNDFEYERGMRQINADLKPEIHSVFLIPPRELAEVSSSFVKGLIGPSGWQVLVKKYVPSNVYEMIINESKR